MRLYQLHHMVFLVTYLSDYFPWGTPIMPISFLLAFDSFSSIRVPHNELVLHLDLFLFVLSVHSSTEVTPSCHLLSSLGRHSKCFACCRLLLKQNMPTRWRVCINWNCCLDIMQPCCTTHALRAICTCMFMQDSRSGHHNIMISQCGFAEKTFALSHFPSRLLLLCLTFTV